MRPPVPSRPDGDNESHEHLVRRLRAFRQSVGRLSSFQVQRVGIRRQLRQLHVNLPRTRPNSLRRQASASRGVLFKVELAYFLVSSTELAVVCQLPTHVDSGATPSQINVRGTDNHVATPQFRRRSSRILRNRFAGFEGHSRVVQPRNTAGVWQFRDMA
jgi:hypothetical protein